MDKSQIDDKLITVEGNPKAIKDKSWIFGIHYNDWSIKYAIKVINRSPYDVGCHYKISSCPFDKSTCVLSYDMHISSIDLKKGSAKNVIDEFDFNYDSNTSKAPPIYSKIDCAG